MNTTGKEKNWKKLPSGQVIDINSVVSYVVITPAKEAYLYFGGSHIVVRSADVDALDRYFRNEADEIYGGPV